MPLHPKDGIPRVRAAGLGDASAAQFRSPTGLVDVQQNREKVIQQKARLRTLMCGRRPGMQEQRVHQNHVTGRGRILDDLERYPIDFFDTFVKPCDTGFRIAVYRSRFWRGCVAHRGCGGSRICSGLRASRIDPMAALRSNSTITKLPRLNSLPRPTLTKSPNPSRSASRYSGPESFACPTTPPTQTPRHSPKSPAPSPALSGRILRFRPSRPPLTARNSFQGQRLQK